MAIAPLARAKAWSDVARYPIYLGEFGAYGKADMFSRVAFTRLVREQTEARGIPWSYWELASGFGVYDPVAHRWRGPLFEALLGHALPPLPTYATRPLQESPRQDAAMPLRCRHVCIAPSSSPSSR